MSGSDSLRSISLTFFYGKLTELIASLLHRSGNESNFINLSERKGVLHLAQHCPNAVIRLLVSSKCSEVKLHLSLR